ncbi:MAG: CBS domain-containing protein, partial [Thiohalophilus sp.]
MAEAEAKDEYRDALQSLLDILRSEDEDKEQIEDLLEEMHPQEIAHLLESLPANDRQIVWEHVPADSEGEILVHLADDVRSAIIDKMDAEQIVAATESLDTDDLADLLPEMPHDIVQEILLSMEQQERERLHSVLSYSEDSAGGLMDLDMVTVRADTTLDVVLRYLRRRGTIPESTDKLFVTDREGRFQGLLPLTALLTHDPEMSVEEIMQHDVVGIPVDMPAREVANMFERRDLITAPV